MARYEPIRPDPEELLRQIQAQERRERCGRLKIFLGYASGVGKSWQLLDEGLRRRNRGEDVVVAAQQPKYPPATQALLARHEIVPALRQDGQEAVDVAALLKRRPGVVLIDGLAYDNPPGCRHEKRWQDVDELLEAGISVIASLNLHHIEDLRDRLAAITGKRAAETVPRSVLTRADEVVVVDAPPAESPADADGLPLAGAALLAERARLSILREKALLAAAEIVDDQLRAYLEKQGVHEMWAIEERILVCISSAPHVTAMIESGRRNADRFHGELHVVHVRDRRRLTAADREALDRHLALAASLGAHLEVLDGPDAAAAILRYARKNGITQIFIGHSLRQPRRWLRWLRPDPAERILREASDIDVSVFPVPAPEAKP